MSPPAGRHGENGEPDLNALAAWADGRLTPAERADLAAHLASCAQCRAIVAELTRGSAPAAAPWRPVLALAATIAIGAASGGVYLLVRDRAQLPVAAPPVTRPASPATPTPSTPAPAAEPSPSPAPTPPADRKRAAGTTQVGGKTFHLVAGEWIDDKYRESDFLPVVEVSSRRQMASNPALRRYASLGSRFTVVIRGTVYKVVLP